MATLTPSASAVWLIREFKSWTENVGKKLWYISVYVYFEYCFIPLFPNVLTYLIENYIWWVAFFSCQPMGPELPKVIWPNLAGLHPCCARELPLGHSRNTNTWAPPIDILYLEVWEGIQASNLNMHLVTLMPARFENLWPTHHIKELSF